MNKRKRFFTIITIIAVWFVLLFIITPEHILEIVGEEHAYLAVFLVASFGGVSALTAASYFSTIITFAAAGLNPYVLGLLGGIGVTIGDSLFFFFGNNSRVVLSDRVERTITAVRKKLERFNEWSIPIFVFLYAGFTPLPNEFMTISVGLTGAEYKEIIMPLLLGNIFITTMTCLGVQYALSLL